MEDRPEEGVTPPEKLYGHTNHMELGEFYTRHVSAMTRESLDSKADIAGELGYRDMIIEDLIQEIDVLRAKLREVVSESVS